MKLQALNETIQRDPTARAYFNGLKDVGAAMLSQPLVDCGLGADMLGAARTVLDREYALGLLWRLTREFKARALGVHDVYHAFNGRRNGLLSCSELGAGFAWLQLQSQRLPRTFATADQMHEADVHVSSICCR